MSRKENGSGRNSAKHEHITYYIFNIYIIYYSILYIWYIYIFLATYIK